MEFTFECGNTVVVDRYTVFQTSPKMGDFEGAAEHIDSLDGNTPEEWAKSYHDRFCAECAKGGNNG